MGASQSSRRRRGNEGSSRTGSESSRRARASGTRVLGSEVIGDGDPSPRRRGSGVRRRSTHSLFRGSSRSLQGSSASDRSFRPDDSRNSAPVEEHASSPVSCEFYNGSGREGRDNASDAAFRTPPLSVGEQSPPSRWNTDTNRTVYLSDESNVPSMPRVESESSDMGRHLSQQTARGSFVAESPPLMPSSVHLSRSHLTSFEEPVYSSTQQMHTSIGVPRFRRSPDMYASNSMRNERIDHRVPDFFPEVSQNYEWMGRSVESLLLGHLSDSPVFALPDGEFADCSSSWFGISQHSITSDQQTTGISSSGERQHALADGRHYASRRGSGSNDKSRRTRKGSRNGPNVVLSLMAREVTGKPSFRRSEPSANRLRAVGGQTLFAALDKPSGGMPSEVALLKEAIENGDWVETQTTVSRLAPRLIGDPAAAMNSQVGSERGRSIDDPSLPPSASPFYAGGGRLGFEREAFVLSGGVELFIRIFREPAFVGDQLIVSNDARDLSKDMVLTKLSGCWNEILASLRELTYALPDVVDNGSLLDGGDFLPFLFTLLAHDTCFDGAATLIEEILSFQSQAPPTPPSSSVDGEGAMPGTAEYLSRSRGHVSPAATFFLGNVPNLYELWGNFSCRQLAHFCRILALLVFEPEDRQLLESPAVLKSLELLQLRRDRAARCGRDAAVDMNQAILLGDAELMQKLLKLLRIMNFSPNLHRSSAYHVMAHFPWIADTLVMVGLTELEEWGEIARLEKLARTLLSRGGESVGSSESSVTTSSLSDLGSISDMLENLSGLLTGNPMEPATQLGHIIRVINAAQQADVVVGRRTQRRARRRSSAESVDSERDDTSMNVSSVRFDGTTMEDLASGAVPVLDQVLLRTVSNHAVGEDGDVGNAPMQVVGIGMDGLPGGPTMHTVHTGGPGRLRISTPEDAANELQFNALLLAPYQVEVLFVLCTLLGGRRKIDTQRRLKEWGLIPVLDDMFHRLSWGHTMEPRRSHLSSESGNGSNSVRPGEIDDGSNHEEATAGIHGPGCECNPESALRVQYLRLLHNFCDRDCDNYSGRRLLLSASERDYVFSGRSLQLDRGNLKPGLLSKVLRAFIGEPDDSPYRFWLASCAESYLRGSSPQEQLFAAQSGLLEYLVEVIVSDRLHCAGSLQTAFDLLGELCKGNPEILRLLVGAFEEEDFRRLMSVAAANLVDSNVFLRSLLLSVERIAASRQQKQLHYSEDVLAGSREFQNPVCLSGDRARRWISTSGSFSRSYLTHSWWDSPLNELPPRESSARFSPGLRNDFPARHGHADDIPEQDEIEGDVDECRPSDWYPPRSFGEILSSADGSEETLWNYPEAFCLNDNVGHFGWVFSPSARSDRGSGSPWDLSVAAFSPNSFERLSWFLAANQTRLLRDLLGVVDLRNINHENICCLNTAVVVAIFAYRRQELPRLIQELRHMNREEKMRSEKANSNASRGSHRHSPGVSRKETAAASVDKRFIQSMRMFEIGDGNQGDLHAGVLSTGDRHALYTERRVSSSRVAIGDRTDVLRNFRELLWFWSEYYTHRGRDRLSLEFSSHVRFHEWKKVVSLLSADDGSPTSLVSNRVRLPKSPYRRAARVMDNRLRGY